MIYAIAILVCLFWIFIFNCEYLTIRQDKLFHIRIYIIWNENHLLPYIPNYDRIKFWNFWYPNTDKILREAREKYEYAKLLN